MQKIGQHRPAPDLSWNKHKLGIGTESCYPRLELERLSKIEQHRPFGCHLTGKIRQRQEASAVKLAFEGSSTKQTTFGIEAKKQGELRNLATPTSIQILRARAEASLWESCGGGRGLSDSPGLMGSHGELVGELEAPALTRKQTGQSSIKVSEGTKETILQRTFLPTLFTPTHHRSTFFLPST